VGDKRREFFGELKGDFLFGGTSQSRGMKARSM